MHKNILLHALLATLPLLGCAGSARVHGSASATATMPDLVYVSPGVQVIADYREPIFYSDRYYWRFDGTIWYRSSSYTSGWVRFQAPAAILRIERPSAYVYYRASAGASTNAPHSAPAVARDERKDEKQEQKQERKELQTEQKEERKELKNDQKAAKKDRK